MADDSEPPENISQSDMLHDAIVRYIRGETTLDEYLTECEIIALFM